MEIKYFGQSCFLVESGGFNVLFDPAISANPLAKDIVDIEAIEADYILLTHAHEDHSADVEAIAKRTGATLVCNFEIGNHYAEKGLENIFQMNHGGKYSFDFGTVKMVQAVHSSSFGDGSNGGTSAGFVVESGDHTYYHAGDTALTMDMKLIGDAYRLNFAMLPIGDVFTMGIDDALTAADFVKVKKVIGMHYDTFPPIEIDHQQAQALALRAEKELILLEIGESIKI